MEKYLVQIIFGAFTTIGIVQWIKNLFTGKDFPTWIYSVVMLVVSVGVGFVFLGLPAWVGAGLAMFACTQIFYENIIQIVKAMLENFVKKDNSEKTNV